MNIEILASKKIEHRSWYLCKCSLFDYLDNLKEEFYQFAIQRRIVKNQYLDSIYKTIKSGDPIPIISLTYDKSTLDDINDKNAHIDMNSVEILDGLQRTFRLWSYKKMSEAYEKRHPDNSVTNFAKELKETNPLFFETGVISTGLIKTLIKDEEIQNVLDVFHHYDIYLVIWSGLTDKEIIQKMLVLNAGQKAVSKTHQFELLFLHYYKYFDDLNTQISLIREKDPNAYQVKKGNRELGEFLFASVIVALQSFAEQRPLRVSTEKLVDFEENEIETLPEMYEALFNNDFLQLYLSGLYDLDQTIYQVEGEIGKEWFVKDTTLSGIFAALGIYLGITHKTQKNVLIEQLDAGFGKLLQIIQNHGFDLNSFTNEYNALSSRSFNIGNFIRKAVMAYTLRLLRDENPHWEAIFKEQNPGGKYER